MGAHCTFEDGLMVGPAGVGAGEHRASHEWLLDQFRALARRIRRGDATLTAAALNHLEDALLNHIQLADRELARRLEPGSP
jgi:hemerythrin